MERYSEYKDSGIQWLGEIPSHWDAVRTKYVARLYTGNSLNEREKEKYSSSVDDCYPYISSKDISLETESVNYNNGLSIPKGEKAFELAPSNSFLLCIEGGSAGRKKAFLTEDVCFVNKLCCFNSEINPKYHYYTLQSFYFGAKFRSSLQGMIGGVSVSTIKNFYLTVPSKKEQVKIVAYLDEIIGKIHTAIEQQKKMIDLLNERKQIIINNAVTKGLNIKAPMKDSGVDWIGEIPEHWGIKRGKFLFDIINEYSSTGEEELLTVSDRTGITPRSMKNVTMFMAESLVGYKKCKIGDICSNIMWMWHGAVGVTKYDGVISPSYGVYRQKKLYYNGEYLDMLLRLPQLVKFYASRSTGLTESRLRLYPDDFMNIYFFVPPIEEQEMIVNRLKTICEPIESAIDAATQQIYLLQERKQIIINDVVTGKVKVS